MEEETQKAFSRKTYNSGRTSKTALNSNERRKSILRKRSDRHFVMAAEPNSGIDFISKEVEESF